MPHNKCFNTRIWINNRTRTDGFRVLCHQCSPSSLSRREDLSHKLHDLLAEDEQAQRSTPPMIQHRRLGSRNPADGIPSSEWPTVLKRVLVKKESLRKVADDYSVSPETIRRVVRAARCGYKASARTDLPRSQHRADAPAIGQEVDS